MESVQRIYKNQYPNEVGPHNPELQLRFLRNPIANWVGRFITDHRRHPNAEFHIDIFDEYAYGTEDEAIIVPRSFAKTTCTENFITYMACEYPRLLKLRLETGKSPVYPFRKMMATSATGPKAEEILDHIRYELENNQLILDEYGDVMGDKWTNRFFRTKDRFEFRVGGRGCQVRGFRPEVFIGDDLEDDEEIESDEQMAKTRRWIDTAVFGTLDETECRGFFIGTDLHPDGILRYIAAKPGVKTKEYYAYKDRVEIPGNELWPSKWPHDRLQKKKAKIGTRAFRQEYLNDPMISENPIFIRQWFNNYEHNSESFKELAKEKLYTIVTCDPAISRKDKADFTAVVTLSATYEDDPKIYIRVGGVTRGHWELGRTVTEIYNKYAKFDGRQVGIETVAYQQALADEFRHFAEAEKRNIRVMELFPDGDKERRANAVAPMVERGKVFVDLRDPMSQLLVNECVNFQPGKVNIKKDLMDAFVYGLKMIKDWGGRKTGSPDPQIVRHAEPNVIRRGVTGGV